MNTKQKTIIFDMDGTLINSGNVIANTINHVRVNFGLEPMEKKHLLACINNPKLNSAQFFYETENFTPKHSELFESYYAKHCVSDIILYDGIYELLKGIKDDFNLAIATNASSNFAKEMTQHLNIDSFFIDIIGANEVKNPKPHPDMINTLIKRNNFNKENTIVVGDSQKDIMSATSANVKSILVNWGFTDHKTDATANVSILHKKLLQWKQL
jgi:phosphoglycolate phosphatase